MTKRLTLPILIFCALSIIYGFLTVAIPSCIDHTCINADPTITVVSYRYRLLQPALTYAFVQPGDVKGILAFDLILQSILSPLMIAGLYKWLRKWTNEERAMIGVLVFTGVYLLSFAENMVNLTIAIEVTCILWTLIYIEKFWVVGLLTIVASMNRETGVVIPALYCFYHGYKSSKSVYSYVELMLSSVAITAAIHFSLGSGDNTLGFVGSLQYNLANLSDAVGIAGLLCPLVIGVVLAFRTAPPVLKRLALVALVYCGAILAAGAWQESLRTLLPVVVIVLPMMVYENVKVYHSSVDDAYMRQVVETELKYRDNITAIQKQHEQLMINHHDPYNI